MKQKQTLILLLLMFAMTAWAQDAVYLLGTDGKTDANHASATLTKNDKGAFVGEVIFEEKRFCIATKLLESDDWKTIKKYWYGAMMDDPLGNGIMINQSKTIWGEKEYIDEGMAENSIKSGFELMEGTTSGGGGGIDFSKPLWVKVTFEDTNIGQITVYKSKTDDPDYDSGEVPGGDEDDGTTPAQDIDLSTGVHFTITLPEAGSLKQRLENEIAQTDYDLVDFLTLKGKFGAKDLAYLKEQKGLVSQLRYLDLTDVELVYDDDEVYYTTVTDDGGDLPVGIVNYYYYYYTLSAENKDEAGGGGQFDGTSTTTITYCRRNDLSYAFSDMEYLQQVKLPKTLPGLGAGIFYQCAKLDKVTFPAAATYIGDNAFENTTGGYFPELRRTLKGVDLPESVNSLGANAMRGVGFRTIDLSHISKLGDGCLKETNITEINLNPDVKTIAASAFSGCDRIASVTIPATLEEIGDEAFKGCENLSSITFAGQVETIGKQAFDGCKKLTAVSINAKHIGESSFAYCNLRSVEVADGAKSIGKFAFNGNRTLTTVTAPNTLEEIGSHAFNGWMEFGVGYYDTPYISNLPAENGVKYIGSVAYLYTGGSKLEVKEGTLGIADDFLKNHEVEVDEYSGSTISGWTAPTTITFPTTLRVIGKQSFLKNTNITTIELPASLEKIGYKAFMDCSKLKGSITIPASTEQLGGYAFSETAITRVYYNAVEAKMIAPSSASETSGHIFPTSLTRAIIGEGVKVIPEELFANSSNLSRVQMPSTVETIGSYAFAGCTSLSHIDLPASLQQLGNYAFAQNGLTSMAVYMAEPIALEPQTFFESAQIALLQVPNGSLTAYQGSSWTAAFQKIEQFDGASDTEAIAESTTVSVSQSVTETTDLSGTVVDGIYITLDTEGSGDGYNASEGCIVINSQTTTEGITAASASGANDLTVKNQLQGMMFEVPAGQGIVTVDCQTLGTRALFVKAGTQEPKKVVLATRNTMDVDYNVAEPTRIFIYAADDEVMPSRGMGHEQEPTAYANTNSVKLYAISVKPGEGTGISAINSDKSIDGHDVYFDLSGRRVMAPQKGVYVKNGRKVVVK